MAKCESCGAEVSRRTFVEFHGMLCKECTKEQEDAAKYFNNK